MDLEIHRRFGLLSIFRLKIIDKLTTFAASVLNNIVSMKQNKLRMVEAILLLFPFVAFSGQQNITAMLSPKLRSFLIAHVSASDALDKVFSKAFSAKKITIYYYYTDNNKNVRAAHYYPAANNVVIIVRENQQPVDEFICLLYEALNSEKEKNFEALGRKAQNKTISRADFALEMVKQEFGTFKKARSIVSSLSLQKTEIDASAQYFGLMKAPSKLEDFLTYSITNGNRDLIKEYEETYDNLPRKGIGP